MPSINHLFRFFVEFFQPLPESLVSTKSTFETDGRLLIKILQLSIQEHACSHDLWSVTFDIYFAFSCAKGLHIKNWS